MPVLEPFIRILIAAILGGLIGIEREIREHTAGFRTHILVSVGSAAFTLASSYGIQGTSFDPNRISAQVVTGIGFLGAGGIMKDGLSISGLTTAASIWAASRPSTIVCSAPTCTRMCPLIGMFLSSACEPG